ncbi:L2 [Gammapapillomavirus 12]|uniref:Minor capsid protein L2 n=1 Tax=Gammapapillomavirus 12 TaxID=1513257 RepID=A0A2D2ALN0_9PAPI|nr:L2 [Gammapapillomavirus 12]
MSARSRRKRASPSDLYQSCLQGGDCITDVKNKFEQTTLADWLLKIFGSVLYLGNLGIGTGRGSGGSLGYRPLGSATGGKPISSTPVRPNITVEPLPVDAIPVLPESSAIVPLAEGGPDINVYTTDGGPGLGAEEIELYTISNSTPDIGSSGSTPAIVTTERGIPAILEVQPSLEGPPQVLYDPSISATAEVRYIAADPYIAQDVHVFVDAQHTGEFIGDYEEIPLQELGKYTFEIDEAPVTSTPTQKLEKTVTRAKQLYNKYVRQVPVTDPLFLQQPSRLVQFEFTNPAFDADVTLTFERDLATVAAAPNEEFADVVKLSRPTFSETIEGVVRVSRLGETGTITTRSGTTIGQKVHFYMDLSNIPNAESIELQAIGEHSGLSTIVDDIVESSIIDPINNANVAVSEADLLDTFTEDFNNGHLMLQIASEDEDILSIPSLPPGPALKVFVPNVGDGLFVSYPVPPNSSTDFTLPDSLPIEPSFLIDDDNTFYLHPALYPKRRRLDLF